MDPDVSCVCGHTFEEHFPLGRSNGPRWCEICRCDLFEAVELNQKVLV